MARIRTLYPLITIAAAAMLVACGDKQSPPPQTNGSPPVSSSNPTPPVTSMPAATPAPQPAATNRAETARDSAATNPNGTMSKGQESNSMPMAGQANNHSSTELESKEAPKQ